MNTPIRKSSSQELINDPLENPKNEGNKPFSLIRSDSATPVNGPSASSGFSSRKLSNTIFNKNIGEKTPLPPTNSKKITLLESNNNEPLKIFKKTNRNRLGRRSISEKKLISKEDSNNYSNPLYQYRSKKEMLIEEMKGFEDQIMRKKWSEMEAVNCLSQLIKENPKRLTLFADVVCDFYESLSNTKILRKRLEKVLVLSLASDGSESFFCLFAKNAKTDLEKFVKIAIKKYQNNQCLLPMLNRITESELKLQNPETLFREKNLSSTLCREYIEMLWEKELIAFSKEIPKAIKQIEVSDQKNEMENSKGFEPFAKIVLTNLYRMKVPDDLMILLTCRRTQIFNFLKNTSETAETLSRTCISEVLILRVLNPQIVNLVKFYPNYRNELLKLTKLIQSLANQSPVTDENQEILESLYESAKYNFCQFIDDCSIGKNF